MWSSQVFALKAEDYQTRDCRREPREAVSERGRLVTTWLRYGVAVEVSDISRFGARLRLEGTTKLPPTFELWLDDKGTVHPCRIAWRGIGEIGVEFAGHPVRATTKVQVALKELPAGK
jgi:hypothetical protein